MIIPCRNKVSIVKKSAVCLRADWGRGGALFLATSHLSVCTVRANFGILAGAACNSLLNISLYLQHNARNLCCNSLLPDILLISELLIIGSKNLNVSVLS